MRESFRRAVEYAFQTRVGCAQTCQSKNKQMRENLPNRRQIGEIYIWYYDSPYSHHCDSSRESKNIFNQNETLFRRIMEVIPIGTKIETTTINNGQRLPTTITLKQKFSDGKNKHTIKPSHSDQNFRISSSNFLTTAGIVHFEPGNQRAILNPQKLFEYTGKNPTNQLNRQLLVSKQICQGHGYGIRSMRRRDYTF